MSEQKKRGRPSAEASSQVYETLLAAAEECLKKKSYRDITMREIASVADTNPAMINYYFNTKEGLFVALVEFLFSEWERCTSSIIQRMPQMTTLPTREFVKAVNTCFYHHTPILRLLTSEIALDGSGIQSVYIERLASRSAKAIERFLSAAQQHNFYKRIDNIHYLSFTIASICSHPTSINPSILKLAYGIETSELSSEKWLAYIESSINRLLEVPSH